MKIVIAKDTSSNKRKVFINASTIESFHTRKNEDADEIETKIYFAQGVACVISGDRTEDICDFIATENDYGILDLTDEPEKKPFWERKKSHIRSEQE